MQFPPGTPTTVEFNSYVALVPEHLIPLAYPGTRAKALIEISKAAVMAGDTSRVRDLVRSLLTDPVKAKQYEGRVAFSIGGYWNDPRFLSEIPEVSRFARTLLDDVPEWLFLLERHSHEVNMWLAILTESKGMQLPSGGVNYVYEVEKIALLTQELLNNCWPAACRNLGRSTQAPEVRRALEEIIDCIRALSANAHRPN